MHLLDLSHTSHSRARTGIQRVARSLHTELTRDHSAQPVTWDPYASDWRQLDPWEIENLGSTAPGKSRGAQWPWRARLRGRFRRWQGITGKLDSTAGLIVPELFSPKIASALAQLNTSGPRVALFHDAIALKLPELTPPGTVARFPGYLRELLAFDGIAAVSEDSRQTLLDYWRWLEVPHHPPVETIPLGIDPLLTASEASSSAPTLPVVLSVGSIEGRKNHLALLEACEALWMKNERFTLRLIGMAHAQTGRRALQKIAELQAAGHPLRYDGAVDEATLQAAYAECAFTVYPSLMEGFGLPVLESLLRGKLCICSSQGALGESARGGGTWPLDSVASASLAAAMERFLNDPAQLARLSAVARGRTFRTWTDYTRDLLTWMRSLK